MEPNKEQQVESEKNISKDGSIYFSMNMPDWFMNESANEKCGIVTALADQLRNEEPISEEQKKELFTF